MRLLVLKGRCQEPDFWGMTMGCVVTSDPAVFAPAAELPQAKQPQMTDAGSHRVKAELGSDTWNRNLPTPESLSRG